MNDCLCFEDSKLRFIPNIHSDPELPPFSLLNRTSSEIKRVHQARMRVLRRLYYGTLVFERFKAYLYKKRYGNKKLRELFINKGFNQPKFTVERRKKKRKRKSRREKESVNKKKNEEEKVSESTKKEMSESSDKNKNKETVIDKKNAGKVNRLKKKKLNVLPPSSSTPQISSEEKAMIRKKKKILAKLLSTLSTLQMNDRKEALENKKNKNKKMKEDKVTKSRKKNEMSKSKLWSSLWSSSSSPLPQIKISLVEKIESPQNNKKRKSTFKLLSSLSKPQIKNSTDLKKEEEEKVKSELNRTRWKWAIYLIIATKGNLEEGRKINEQHKLNFEKQQTAKALLDNMTPLKKTNEKKSSTLSVHFPDSKTSSNSSTIQHKTSTFSVRLPGSNTSIISKTSFNANGRKRSSAVAVQQKLLNVDEIDVLDILKQRRDQRLAAIKGQLARKKSNEAKK